MRRTLTVAAAMAVMMLGMVAPAGANFSNGPSEAGVVERFDSPGLAVVPDFEEGLLVFANVNSIADACNDIPAGAGDEQAVYTPSGREHFVLHDADVPVIVAPLAPPDVVCANPAAWEAANAIAYGSGNVRGTPGGFRVIGSVEDANGDLWSLQATFKPNSFGVHLVKRG